MVVINMTCSITSSYHKVSHMLWSNITKARSRLGATKLTLLVSSFKPSCSPARVPRAGSRKAP